MPGEERLKGKEPKGIKTFSFSSSDSPVSEKPPFPPTRMGGRRLSERLVTLPRVPTAPFTSPAPFNVRPVSALHDEATPLERWPTPSCLLLRGAVGFAL